MNNMSGDEIEKNAQKIADDEGKNVYKCSIENGLCPDVYYYLGYSTDDINDQTELYKELFHEDEDGETAFDNRMVHFECLAECD